MIASQLFMLSSTAFFQLEDFREGFEFNNFTLKQGSSLLSTPIPILPPPLLNAVGAINLNSIRQVPCFLSAAILDNANINEYTYKWFNELNNLLGFLWFVKDCSASANSFFTHRLNDNFVNTLRSDKSFCTSEGRYENTIFSMDDLRKASRILNKFYDVTNGHDTEIDISNNTPKHSFDETQKIVPGHTFLTFNKRHRIERALMFLYKARSEQFIPLKITFYMCMYETLFTTDDKQISYKVSRRASCYIGQNEQERDEIYKLVKSAYNVRSNFVHGQKLEKLKTYDALAPFSKSIDELTRKLFYKVLFEDSAKFSQNNKQLAKWLTQLTYDANI